jgi:hypothetical protein
VGSGGLWWILVGSDEFRWALGSGGFWWVLVGSDGFWRIPVKYCKFL